MNVKSCLNRLGLVGVTALVIFSVSASGAIAQHSPGQHADHDATRHMEHRFDDAERYAQSFDDPTRDEWQMPDRVIEALEIEDGDAVADIGAGTGYFTVRLATRSKAATVYAVDIEPSMVDYIQARADSEGLEHVVPVLADSAGPNLPEPVDVVLIVNTFHHIPDRIEYFRALRGSLTPTARLAIVDYAKGAPGGGPPDHFRFTPEEITAQLGEAGFRLRSRHDFLPRQSFLIYEAADQP